MSSKRPKNTPKRIPEEEHKQPEEINTVKTETDHTDQDMEYGDPLPLPTLPAEDELVAHEVSSVLEISPSGQILNPDVEIQEVLQPKPPPQSPKPKPKHHKNDAERLKALQEEKEQQRKDLMKLVEESEEIRKLRNYSLEKVIVQEESKKYQSFVNETFRRRRHRTIIWLLFIFLCDVAKMAGMITCIYMVCLIHPDVLKGAYIYECLIIYLVGVFLAILCELSLFSMVCRRTGFNNSECCLTCSLFIMLIGCVMQFCQLVPFGVDEDTVNSYAFNTNGGQELCRQYAHRTLKISLCEEKALCKAWADIHWLVIRIIVSLSLCVNIITIFCIIELICFSRYYYTPGRTAWREYIEYRKLVLLATQSPPSPDEDKSPPSLSPQVSGQELTKAQSKILNKFEDVEPNYTVI